MKSEAIRARTEDPEGLPALVGKITDDLTELFDAKLTLLKIELREDVEAYSRNEAMMVGGGFAALVGFAILNVAAAFMLSSLFESTGFSQPVRYGFGFGIAALIYLAAGAVLIVVNKSRLAAQGIMPTRTVNELKKDKERIEQEI